MKELQSSLEGQEGTYEELSGFFQKNGFDLGGGWTNDHGYFDRMLDPKEHTTGTNYLRIPVSAKQGNIGEAGAQVTLGKPFVLCHQYQDSLDDHTEIRVVGAMLDQFAEPEQPDAPVKQEYVQKAQSVLQEIEQKFQNRGYNQ